MTAISFNLNGKPHRAAVPGDTQLLFVLRETLGMTGTKLACGQGVCGACTVLVNGKPVRACVTPVSSVSGKKVLTVEGLEKAGFARLQEAWLAEDVSQCGYCQPGMLMAAAALITQKPKPNDADIDEAMGDMLCRCGTYNRIRAAIHRATQGVKP